MVNRNLVGWTALVVAGLAIISSLVGASPCLAAQDAGNNDSTVSLEFTDAYLNEVINILAQMSGANIVMLPGDERLTNQMVTLKLQNVSVEDALREILNETGIRWEFKNNIYFVGGKEAAPAPSAKVVPLASVVPPPTAEKPKAKPHFSKIKLNYTGTEDMVTLLRTGSCASQGTVLQFDTATGTWVQSDQVHIYEDPFGANRRPAYGGREARTSDMVTRSGVGIDPTITIEQIGPGGPSGRAPGAPGGAAGAAGGGGFLPEGVDVTPYPLDNSIIVSGDPEAIEQLQDIISLLDVPPMQVEIKTAFVEVTEGIERRFGIDWRTRLGGLSVAVAGLNQGGNLPRIDWTHGNWESTLQALMSENKAKVVNAPIITTMNNRPATITITQEIPVEVAQRFYVPGGGQDVIYTADTVTAQTGLYVLPRVNGDGSIDVLVTPIVSDATRTKILPHSGEYPIVTTQQLQTQRRVMSGQTIVLGGLSRKSTSYDTSGLPLLRDIPFFGKLFEGRRKSSTDSELLIFLTPTLIKDVSTNGGL